MFGIEFVFDIWLIFCHEAISLNIVFKKIVCPIHAQNKKSIKSIAMNWLNLINSSSTTTTNKMFNSFLDRICVCHDRYIHIEIVGIKFYLCKIHNFKTNKIKTKISYFFSVVSQTTFNCCIQNCAVQLDFCGFKWNAEWTFTWVKSNLTNFLNTFEFNYLFLARSKTEQ